jgi:hypothetical protein
MRWLKFKVTAKNQRAYGMLLAAIPFVLGVVALAVGGQIWARSRSFLQESLRAPATGDVLLLAHSCQALLQMVFFAAMGLILSGLNFYRYVGQVSNAERRRQQHASPVDDPFS